MEKKSENIPLPSTRQPRIAVMSSISQGTREYQEDACGHWADPAGTRLFAVVADGAGGHGGGADAARVAIASAKMTWEKSSAGDLAEPADFLAKWMAAAHRAVNEESARIRRSARAVVVACLTDDSTAHWVHAGDCRLLRFREGKLVERTRDDSVVQVLFERGDITEEEMGTHPDQSRLLQSLGGEEPPSPRPGNAEVAAGDVLILCSDGFWEHLKREELEKLVAEPPARRQRALDQAVAQAVRRGGQKADNTTALMITFGETKGGGSGSGIRWALLLLLAALAGAGVALLWGGCYGGWKELWRKIEQAISQSGTPSAAHGLAAGRMPAPQWTGHPPGSK
jgi:serine/threonine protein phosphatase PrpC